MPKMKLNARIKVTKITKSDSKEAVKKIEAYYLSNKKNADLGTHSSFSLFSLDASDLQVLENIEKGVSGKAKDIMDRKLVVERELSAQDNQYKDAKLQLKIIMGAIKEAKEKQDLDILDECKKALEKMSSTREEIIIEKEKVRKVLHNAIKQLEV